MGYNLPMNDDEIIDIGPGDKVVEIKDLVPAKKTRKPRGKNPRPANRKGSKRTREDLDADPTVTKIEDDEKIRAFQYYLDLGDDRTLPKVAEYMGKSLPTVYRWSLGFQWQERIKNLRLANISNGEEAGILEPLQEQIDKRKFNLRMIDVMLRDAAVIDDKGDIVGSTIKLRSMSDIRTAMELRELILNGKTGGRAPAMTGPQTTNIEKAVFIIKK